MSLDVGIRSSGFYHRALSTHTVVTDIRQLDALGLKPDKLESSLPTTPQLRPGNYILETFSISNCQTVLSSTALAHT